MATHSINELVLFANKSIPISLKTLEQNTRPPKNIQTNQPKKSKIRSRFNSSTRNYKTIGETLEPICNTLSNYDTRYTITSVLSNNILWKTH